VLARLGDGAKAAAGKLLNKGKKGNNATANGKKQAPSPPVETVRTTALAGSHPRHIAHLLRSPRFVYGISGALRASAAAHVHGLHTQQKCGRKDTHRTGNHAIWTGSRSTSQTTSLSFAAHPIEW
jgi:hypothetical protein